MTFAIMTAVFSQLQQYQIMSNGFVNLQEDADRAISLSFSSRKANELEKLEIDGT